MPELLPFRGLRYAGAPRADGCPDVSPLIAPPYDVIDDPSVLEARHPNNAVRLILPGDDAGGDRYAAAATRLRAWTADGVLAADAGPRLYRYSMRFTRPDGTDGHTVGVVGALQLPTREGTVLPHERTLPNAKSDRLALLRATRANLDPIWVLSLANGLTQLEGDDDEALACGTDDEGVAHRLSAIDDPARIAAIAEAVASAPVVIADGHHRFETARTYQAEQPDEPGAAAIMALVVECAADELHVAPIHRVIHGAADLRAHLGAWFELAPLGADTDPAVDGLPRKMIDRGALGLVDRDGVALLTPTPALEQRLAELPRELQGVDAARVDMAIGALNVDVSYRASAPAVTAAIRAGTPDAAILLRPVSVDQIRAVAAAGLRMPQKTSYFWPKPRTGMVFRQFDT
ncbi:MAG: DUF1015 family protein [Acidimicrobiia bacterium]